MPGNFAFKLTNLSLPRLEGNIQVKGGGEGDRLGMDADGAGLGVGDEDDIGIFDVLVIQDIQNGNARFHVIFVEAVAVNKGNIQPVIG
jgi:hypothetical protein